MPALHTLRIIGSGGANRAMEAEVKRLAPRVIARRPHQPRRIDTQTLVYPYEQDFAEFAVRYLRTPSRVMRDVAELTSARLEPLYEELREQIAAERPDWLEGVAKISVRVVEPIDFPASGLQLRGTVKNAIIDGARAHGLSIALDADSPDLELTLRGKQRPLVLGIDLAGGSMHQRGYRLEEGEAPLKETLAAQILILARWDSRTEMLIDPLAGAGTITIEGALMARGAPLKKGPPELFPEAAPKILANEIHTPLVQIARRNAERAGVAELIEQRHGDLRDLNLEAERGLLVANPPYGKRLEKGRGGERDVLELYADLADLHRRLGTSFRAAYIIANDEFEEIYGGKPSMKKPIWNGQIRAFLLVYDQPPR